MSCGAAGGLNVALKTLLNPGDEVIAVSPYFVEYGNYVANYGGKLVVVPADRPGFQPDPAKLAAAATSRTKAVILNSPNNPTGVIYSADTIAAVAAALEKKQAELGTSIYILSDEPYRELVYDGSEVPYVTKYYRNAIVCYSWSKSLSLPGDRVGYIVIPGELDDYALIFDAACIATRILGFVNAPSLTQLAVARCLDEKTDIEAYGENRRMLYDGLISAGFECVFPQGAFYMWVAAPNGDDAAFTAAAKKYNILVVPGASFACPGYVRIAYCVSRDVIKRSLPAFQKLALEYRLSRPRP
jgi:aspartate aminotransferase